MKQWGKQQSPITRAFRTHESALRAFVSRLVATSSDVDDVTQETFLRAFNAKKATQIHQPRSFLFTVARNIVLSDFSRKANRLTDSIADFDAFGVIEEQDVGDEVYAEEIFAQYCSAIATLPEQCRRVLSGVNYLCRSASIIFAGFSFPFFHSFVVVGDSSHLLI